jgi:hypothetical protein
MQSDEAMIHILSTQYILQYFIALGIVKYTDIKGPD